MLLTTLLLIKSIQIFNQLIEVVYYSTLIISIISGSLKYSKLSKNLKLLLFFLASGLCIEFLGRYFNYRNWSNNLIYILFDYGISNFYLFFYLTNLQIAPKRINSVVFFLINALIFFLCYVLNKKLSDFDFSYTLFSTFINFILGIALFWIHLGENVKKSEVIKLNFLFIYFVLMGLINKFLMYYSYLESQVYFEAYTVFIFLYNIIGFVYSIRLLLSKNEN